jgi:hypothetical protein
MRSEATRRAPARVVAPLVTALLPLAVACDGERRPPARLADSTPARISPVAFEGVREPVVETTARVDGVRSPPACRFAAAGASRKGVWRVSVTGESITVVSPRERAARACDRTSRAGWCGVAYARLRGGMPDDPRLSMTCRDADGDPVGFAWVSPGADAAYVLVTADGFVEAYPVVAGAPVRVTTRAVDERASTARLTVSEHSPAGRRLRSYVVDAQVAG